MGGDCDLPGAARRRSAPEGLERRGRAGAPACGTPGRAQKGAPPTPAIDGRPTNKPAAQSAASSVVAVHDTGPPPGGSQRTNALSARPRAVRRARVDVLSRRTAKKAGPSAQRGQNKRAIPVGACRRQRAPISRRAHQPGASRGRPAPAEGVRADRRAGRQGKAFPALAQLAKPAYLMRAGRCQ